MRGIFSFIIVASAFLISCNKDPELIGLDLLSPADRLKVGVMDTTTIVAYSVYDEAVRTDELASRFSIIGSIYDPVFGKTSGTLYTQVQLTDSVPAFGTSAVCDSMILVLPYASLFGDSTALQTFSVYELTESLALDSVYLSSMHAEYNVASLLAQKTFRPRVKDSVTVALPKVHKIAPMLRLKFNNALGARILAASANELRNNANFMQFFKGFAVVANEQNTPGKGSLVSFDLGSGYTSLRMYYHNTQDTTVYDFRMGTAAARFNQYNHFGHTNAAADFKAQLSGDTTLGLQKLYIQALGGTKIKLRFPYLKKWASTQKISINEAQLVVKNADPSGAYVAPSLLGLRVILKGGLLGVTTDEIVEGTSFFDGTYNSAKSYRFRISRYIQQLLNPKTDHYGLYLFVPNSIAATTRYNRLVLDGTNKQLTGHMKLEIRYTIVSQ